MPAFLVPPESTISMACKFETHKPHLEKIARVIMRICDLSNKQCVNSFSCDSYQDFCTMQTKMGDYNLVQDSSLLLRRTGGVGGPSSHRDTGIEPARNPTQQILFPTGSSCATRVINCPACTLSTWNRSHTGSAFEN